jgi:hypothetical protein
LFAIRVPPRFTSKIATNRKKNDERPLHIVVLVRLFFLTMASRKRNNCLLYSDESTDASSVDFDSSGDEFDGEIASNDYHETFMYIMQMYQIVIRAFVTVQDDHNMLSQYAFNQFYTLLATFAVHNDDVSIFVASCEFIERSPSVYGQRFRWGEFTSKFGHQPQFTRHIRMSLSSFNKLLSYIHDEISVAYVFVSSTKATQSYTNLVQI